LKAREKKSTTDNHVGIKLNKRRQNTISRLCRLAATFLKIYYKGKLTERKKPLPRKTSNEQSMYLYLGQLQDEVQLAFVVFADQKNKQKIHLCKESKNM
jgi:hypothetical protein